MSKRKDKYSLGVGVYDVNSNLINKFANNVELDKFLSISKVTVGKYMNSGEIFKGKYIFKAITK